jgi:hypothetical protein
MMEGKCCYGEIKSVQKLFDYTKYFIFGFIMVKKKKLKYAAHKSVFGKSRNILKAEKILSHQETPCIKELI